MQQNRVSLDVSRDLKFAAFREKGFQSINGWLDPIAVEFCVALSEIQRKTGGGNGAACEIGVWQGKFLSLLTFLTEPGVPVIGIDSFVHCPDSKRQAEILHKNLAEYAWHPERVKIINSDSKYMSRAALFSAAGGAISLFHIDGDHTAEGTIGDLHLASSVLEPGGLLILDDISNLGCPGVVEAAVRFCLDSEIMKPFLITSNKLFLADPESASRFREELFKECTAGRLGSTGKKIVSYRSRMKSLGIPVQLCGSEVLVPGG